MTTNIVLTNLFEGKPVRVFEKDNDIWMPIADIAGAWGIARSTPDKILIRNIEVFDNLSHPVVDVMSNTPVTCLNERGLYLMMGKISASRLKNPAAKESIIRFQRWVPELIQKYRKKEIVQVSKEPDYAATLNAVRFVKELSGMVGCDPLPLVCQALDNYNLGMYGGLLVVQKDIVRPIVLPEPVKKPKDYFTATDIGERIGKTPYEVHMMLYQRKPPVLIKEDHTGEWRLTEYGKQFGEERTFDATKGQIKWWIAWNRGVLRLFNMPVHEDDVIHRMPRNRVNEDGDLVEMEKMG